MSPRRWPRPYLALIAALGCSDTTELLPQAGRDAAPDARDATVRDASGGGAASGDAAGGGTLRCGDHACACDDGVDQDDDTLVDGLDPECTGPFDDDEASFGTGADGSSLPSCQGCFWHESRGSGTQAASNGMPGAADETCSRPLDCALDGTASIAASDTCGSCDEGQACRDACMASTPNGCDCFGCCEATVPQGTIHVMLASTCSLRDVADPIKCPRCTPSELCVNPCGTCQLCGTRKRRDLPRECRGMPNEEEPVNQCDEGQRVCDELTPCPETYYCQLGCCRIVVL